VGSGKGEGGRGKRGEGREERGGRREEGVAGCGHGGAAARGDWRGAWYTRGSGECLTPTPIYSVACPDDASRSRASGRYGRGCGHGASAARGDWRGAWYTRGSRECLTPTPIYSVACPDDTRRPRAFGRYGRGYGHGASAAREIGAEHGIPGVVGDV
jgi:hypothetical protein